MKRHKKSLAIVLIGMMAMMLASCSAVSGGIGTGEAGTPQNTAAAKEEQTKDEAKESENEASVKNNEETSSPQATKKQGKAEFQFIDIGQGDSILLKSDGKTMLVDAGNNEYGDGLVDYLKDQGVEKIDYLIGTHPDADHIGGLDIVIKNLDIGTIYMPKKQSNTKTFEDVLRAVAGKGLKIKAPKVSESFQVGSAAVTVLGPVKSYEDNNNNSIVLKVVHGENSFLLTGDAELEAEEDMIAEGENLQATVLKVGHHGSHTSTSRSLLSKVDPKYAVISAGAGNSYGHPHRETMTYLKDAGIKVYRTDLQKTITMVSDGTGITVKTDGKSVEASDDASRYQQSESEKKTQQKEDAAEQDTGSQKADAYIGNKNTKKFHRPDCSSLPEKQNQVAFKSRQEAVDAGYDACGRCNP